MGASSSGSNAKPPFNSRGWSVIRSYSDSTGSTTFHAGEASSSTAPVEHGKAYDDPLNPNVETNDLGLPLSSPVLPASILQPPLANLTTSQLRNLHRLAAIDPPVADSDEERRLHNGLQQLVGLMDQVQAVELGYGTDRSGREKIREDLVRGFGRTLRTYSTGRASTKWTWT